MSMYLYAYNALILKPLEKDNVCKAINIVINMYRLLILAIVNKMMEAQQYAFVVFWIIWLTDWLIDLESDWFPY